MKKAMWILAVLLVASMVLGGCKAKPTPTPVPSRQGAMVDSVTFTSIDDSAQGIAQLKAGQIDIYAYTISDPDLFNEVKSSDSLTYSESFGSYTELTFNPVGPEFNDGRFNPFSNPKIREAMNWLIDRDYIIKEIYGGLGVAKFFPITAAFPDYARYIDTVRKLEIEYAHNPEKAAEIITAEMEAMGATKGDDGKWMYNGEPVTIIFLIRTEDERTQIGDYVSNLLEDLGFTVDRQYKTRSEASPIWIGSDPAEGQWHIYTGGWITTVVDRNQESNFDFFYTPRGIGVPLWQAYTPDPEFDEVSERLANADYANMEERGQLFAKALELCLKDSVRVWIADAKSFTPYVKNLSVAADLAGAVSGSYLWPYTIHFTDKEGGDVRWAQPGVLIDPWNPIGGSNWIYDTAVIRATGDQSVLYDPYTGLVWPQRIEKAEVVAKEGLPISKSLDWVSLEFVPEIQVPEDAWADWDPVEQRFITAGEKYTETVTANVKTVVYYPADLFEKVKWHDGSPLSMGDFILGMILTFDRGKEESPIYDESAVPALQSFLSHFKGVRIVSTDPLVIETYDDAYALDAELSISTWWPYYDFGQGAWHSLALGIRAEADGKLAFTSDKADANGVEWMSYVAGPSLDILKEELDKSVAENYIPYAPMMSQYVTEDEAKARWANYQKWYTEKGHFWIGTGPFYLDQVSPVEKSVTIRQYAGFPDPADKWLRFGEPMLVSVEVSGPDSISAGDEATFDVYVTYKGEPYPADQLVGAKFLLIDSSNTIVTVGDAAMVEDGHYQFKLGSDVTSGMPSGSAKVEIAVTSKAVSIPGMGSFNFVVQ